MRIIVNGIEHNSINAKTISELLKELGIDNQRIAVEVNREIVRKALYREFYLKDGDVVEIVNFVGGG